MTHHHRLVRAGAVLAAAVTASVVLTAAPAAARSGNAYTSDLGDIAGHTHFNDAIDVYSVYDDDSDHEGVVGWIQVRRANGTWRTFPRVYVGTGNGTHRSAYHDVGREKATVRIWACRQNGPTGTPYSCGRADVSG